MTPPAGAEAWRHVVMVIALTVGGALGVNARFWLGLLIARWAGIRFPWATLAINVSGSFAIGLVAMVLAERWPHPDLRLFAVTGFLGGYTTFSAYVFETITLWERGARVPALGYLIGSVALGLLAVILGMAFGRRLAGPPAPTAAHEARVGQRLESISETVTGRELSAEEPIAVLPPLSGLEDAPF